MPVLPHPPMMSPSEFNLMKVLWRLGQGTVAEVKAGLAEHTAELAYTTVMTTLSRMAVKGTVQVDKSRQPFVYRPAFRRESVLRDRLRRFVETVFDGQAASLVLHLVEDESLSLEELRRIEEKLGGGDRDE